MKVLLVHSRYQQLGGEESVLASEMNLLAAGGVDVSFLEVKNDDFVGIRGKLQASKAVFYSGDGVDRLKEIAASLQPDIVHVHNWFPSLSPAIFRACHRMSLPVVHTLHNYRLLCIKASLYRDGLPCEACLGSSFRLAGVVRACYRGSRLGSAVATAGMLTHWHMGTWHNTIDRFIALSEFARAKLIQGGLPAEKISVKANCLDDDPGPQSGQGGYFAYVGRFTEEKGLLAVLRCWQANPGLPLLRVAGSGPLEEQVRLAASSLGNVEWLGPQTSRGVAGLLGGARALICPSLYYEGMPRVVVEALAAGTPVIASRIGTLIEMIDHGRTGMLFTPNDEQSLFSCINEFLLEREGREMRAACRRVFELRYSAANNLRQLLRIYEQTLFEARGRVKETLATV